MQKGKWIMDNLAPEVEGEMESNLKQYDFNKEAKT